MIAHILFNMLCLWQVGQWLEPMLGWARFLTLYLISALGGSVGYLLLAAPPTSAFDLGHGWLTPMVGASGAVFGLFGATVVFLRHVGASLVDRLDDGRPLNRGGRSGPDGRVGERPALGVQVERVGARHRDLVDEGRVDQRHLPDRDGLDDLRGSGPQGGGAGLLDAHGTITGRRAT